MCIPEEQPDFIYNAQVVFLSFLLPFLLLISCLAGTDVPTGTGSPYGCVYPLRYSLLNSLDASVFPVIEAELTSHLTSESV